MHAPVLSVVLVFCIIHFVSATSRRKDVKDFGKVEDKSSKDESSSFVDINISSVYDDGSPANTVIPQDLPIPNKQSGIRERICQSTTAEYLQGLAKSLQQKVYNAAGVLYEKGTPVRNFLANCKHLQKALEIWNKIIELKDKTQKEQIETLIDLISEETVKHLPIYTKINPIEEISTTKYVCGTKGVMKDLRSIEKVGMKIDPIDGDGFIAEIDYKFNHLHFRYTEFYIKALHSIKRRGYLDIDFKDNNIKVKLKISTFSQIIPKLVRKQCIVSVLDIEVTKLDFVSSTLSGPKNDNKRKFLSARIKKYLQKNQEKLRTRFKHEVLIKLHTALTTDKAWICKGEGIAEEVKSNGGGTDDYVASEKFRKECGKELYIELSDVVDFPGWER